MTDTPQSPPVPIASGDLYASAFKDLPQPATLIDVHGIIVDINAAFITYARRTFGLSISREDRIGHHIMDFAQGPQGQLVLADVLETILKRGQQIQRSWVNDSPNIHRRYLSLHGLPIKNARGLVTGGLLLRDDITAIARKEQCRLAIAAVREKVWDIQHSEDLDGVMIALRDGLRDLGLPFHACGINLIIPADGPASVISCNMDRDGTHINRQRHPAGQAKIRAIWEACQIAYRPDLAQADPNNEIQLMERFFAQPIRSVVDVPFASGTLAINSTLPEAFSTEDIEIIQEMTKVLEEGLTRIQDFQRLEERSTALELQIKERSAAEAALRHSEEQFQRMANHIDDVLYSIDVAADQYDYLSPAFERLTGYSPEEVRAQGGHTAFLNRIRVAGEHAVPDSEPPPANASPTNMLTESRWRCKNGTIKYIEDAWTPIYHNGRLTSIDGVLRDITPHKQAERLLQLNLALQNIRTEILQMQSEADWHRVSIRFYKDLKALLPIDQATLFLIDLENNTYTSSAMDQTDMEPVVYTDIPPPLKQAAQAKQPQYFPTRQALALAGYPLDPALGCLLVAPFTGGVIRLGRYIEHGYEPEDIQMLEPFSQVMTEGYRRLEDLQQLAIQEKQLHQAQRLEVIGRLAGGVAHDFNNMLTAIVGPSAQLLNLLPHDTPYRPDLELIHEAGHRAAQLTQQLLAFSRRQILRPRVLELNATMSQLIVILPRMLGEDIDLQTQFAPNAGHVEIDPGQLEQVILNLAVNARDALPEGGVFRFITQTVELDRAFCSQHPDLSPGTYVRLEVSDTGQGMDEQTRLRVFEPFFTTKGPGKATGLGLSTVFGIVKQSKGHIWVESTPGHGTTFNIVFPQIGKPPAPMPDRPVDATARSTGETILVVEDEPLVRSMITSTLETGGYRVLSVANGQEALALPSLDSTNLDLLLSDVVLPRMNGRQLADHLHQRHPGLKVLFISGYDTAQLSDLSLDSPGMGFLAKPFEPEALYRAVRTLLNQPTP